MQVDNFNECSKAHSWVDKVQKNIRGLNAKRNNNTVLEYTLLIF